MKFKKRNNTYFFLNLPSTQDKAGELILKGALSGTMVIAGIQTEGRGRRGRAWQSPSGGLWFSLILFPVSARQAGEITLSAARALRLTLKSLLGLETLVKLPNDVYFQDKKLAGIILEIKQDRAVLGVGLNVNCRTGFFPAGISAVSLREITKHRVSRSAILSSFLENLRRETGLRF